MSDLHLRKLGTAIQATEYDHSDFYCFFLIRVIGVDRKSA